MAGNLALVEHDMLLRVDAGGDEGRRHLAGVAREFGRAAPDIDAVRDRMHVDDAIDDSYTSPAA